MWWQGDPHPRTGSRKTSVAEAVVCAWNNIFSQTSIEAEAGQCRQWADRRKLHVGTTVSVQPATGEPGTMFFNRSHTTLSIIWDIKQADYKTRRDLKSRTGAVIAQQLKSVGRKSRATHVVYNCQVLCCVSSFVKFIRLCYCCNVLLNDWDTILTRSLTRCIKQQHFHRPLQFWTTCISICKQRAPSMGRQHDMQYEEQNVQ